MPEKNQKPQRLDKNGRPYPGKKAAPRAAGKTAPAGKKAAGAKPPKAAPVGKEYPQDWLFLHREACPIHTLKACFPPVPGLDVEVWPELQISEITFPNKVFMDFEYTATPPQEAALLTLLEREGIQTVYYVSVEPVCGEAELAFLQQVVTAAGGLLVADNDALSPVLR